MKRTGVCGVVVLLVGMMIISRCHHPTPSAGAVEIAAAGITSDQQVLKELVAAFDQAEIAVQQANLEALMSFYGKDYNYHGLRRPDVRRVWSEVFSHYGHVRSRHVFSDLQVVQKGSQKQAFVTCTGGLYGTDKDSGTSITIDSWVGEVHSLVKENDRWKFQGNVRGISPFVPPTSAPHHPLF
jgi:ketosteroid isomerase-like protein